MLVYCDFGLLFELMDELGCLKVHPFRFELVLASLSIKMQALCVLWGYVCIKSLIKSLSSLRVSFSHLWT